MSLSLSLSLLWIGMCVSALISPFMTVLNHLSHYGKLSKMGRPRCAVRWPLWIHNGTAFTEYYFFATVLNTWMLIEAMHTSRTGTDLFVFRIIRSFLPSTYSASDGDSDILFAECLVVMLCMELQVVRRLYESVFISKHSEHAHQHIVVFVVGLLFYTLAVITPCVGLIGSKPPTAFYLTVADSRSIRGALGGTAAGGLRLATFAGEHFEMPWRIYVAGALFVVAWAKQLQAHLILAALRGVRAASGDKDAQGFVKSSSTSRYGVPYGGWFEYVSAPHYFAEILIYLSFAIMRPSSVPQWLELSWVITNLGITAKRTHEFYLRTFDPRKHDGESDVAQRNFDAIRRRKRLVPFVW